MKSPDEILKTYAKAAQGETPRHPDAIPDEFVFRSKVVVLSNEPEIPDYLGDGVLGFQINYDRQQSMELIDRNLETIGSEYPELTLDDKREVLTYLRHIAHGGRTTIDLRTFLHVALIWKTRNPQREAWIAAQLH